MASRSPLFFSDETNMQEIRLWKIDVKMHKFSIYSADFHRLEYFQDFGDGGKQLLGQSNEMSEIWKNALEEKQKHPSLPQDD